MRKEMIFSGNFTECAFRFKRFVFSYNMLQQFIYIK